MAFVCSLCGGIVLSGKDFPVCSLSGNICIDKCAKTAGGFVDAINILKQKGYQIIGYNLPRLDEWEPDYILSIVFSLHTVPNSKPPFYYIIVLPELYGAALRYDYDPEDYEDEVKRSAIELKQWAAELPAIDYGL